MRGGTHSLYAWVKKYSKSKETTGSDDHAAENRRLKRELARVTEERDILKFSRLANDLGDQGETFCPNRLARLASLASIAAQIGYKRRPGNYGAKPSVVVDNTLNRQLDVGAPNQFCLRVIASNPLPGNT
jgi:hypothetical protein